MDAHELNSHFLNLVADRFRALAEPTRLRLLDRLRAGERSVTELVAETGLGQANVSKHLQLLRGLGFVTRRKQGLFVYYGLADERIFQLCDIMCTRLEAEFEARRWRAPSARKRRGVRLLEPGATHDNGSTIDREH